MNWRQADKIKVQFRGRKGHQEQVGNARVRTRDVTHGAGSDAVALMVELLSLHPMLPASARCHHTAAAVKLECGNSTRLFE